jgi:hypothetical protein
VEAMVMSTNKPVLPVFAVVLLLLVSGYGQRVVRTECPLAATATDVRWLVHETITLFHQFVDAWHWLMVDLSDN